MPKIENFFVNSFFLILSKNQKSFKTLLPMIATYQIVEVCSFSVLPIDLFLSYESPHKSLLFSSFFTHTRIPSPTPFYVFHCKCNRYFLFDNSLFSSRHHCRSNGAFYNEQRLYLPFNN